ncbi:DUF1028 domain-containing protein [bacterium]|nr:DUF1028 domain-containing protein [bacterium]
MKIKNICFLFGFILLSGGNIVKGQSVYKNNFAHTFSIVAWDSDTGEMGVAVQSHWFSVGTLVSWAEPGVGAVATQSFINASFGPRGLDLLREGKTAREALDILIKSDEGRDVRQLAIVDCRGNAAAYTGKKCISEAGHYIGKHFSVQANMMLKSSVWPEMAKAYEESKGMPLAERLVAALEAAQGEGGDIRGKQSAALIVVKGISTGKIWEDRLIDLRVDDDQNPVKKIKRLLKLHRAYNHMNAGDLAVEKNNTDLALKEYSTAEKMFPENLEMKYWHAVSLANMGRVDQSLLIFKEVFSKNENWRDLTIRLPAAGLLKVSSFEFKKITNIK